MIVLLAVMSNATYEDYDDEYVASDGVLIFAGFIIIFMIIQAVIGNSLTILSFIRDKQLRTTYNIYLVNLAVADLMIATISMSIYLTYTLRRNVWLYGYLFCKVYLVLDFIACSFTIIIMNFISYDRLMLLKQGASYYSHQSTKNACCKIALSWILAFILYGPAIIGWDHWTGIDTVEHQDCDVQFAHDYVFTITSAILEFLLPLICLGILNTLVIMEIRNLRHNKVHVMQVSSIQNTNLETLPVEISNKSDKATNQSTKRARKAARSLAILVIAFVITWAPYTILTVVISFCEDCVSIPVYEAFTWILWFKASLNPFLYAFSSNRFRENFLFFMCCGKKNIRKI